MIPEGIIFKTAIAMAAVGGFFLARYIWLHKRVKTSREPMVCPLNFECDPVIHSNFSRFLGAPVEILGMLYYGLLAIAYAFWILIAPDLTSPTVSLLLVVFSAAAFLFSLYLTFIQAFALKRWCSWCLVSAGLCFLIFGLTVVKLDFNFIYLLETHHAVLDILHLMGVAIGVGAATVADVFFFKFLRDGKSSEDEASNLRTLSNVVWFGLAILLITGAGLYLVHGPELADSAKFLAKMVIVGVIILNGAVLNLVISPKLVQISFGAEYEHEIGELRLLRRRAFALGAVSITSWYAALVLGALRHVDWEFLQIILTYLTLLLAAIIVSQIFERIYARRKIN